LHRKCLPELTRLMRENTNHPSSEGTFFIPTPHNTRSVGGSRFSAQPGGRTPALAQPAADQRQMKVATVSFTH
jgi:hypothetical protein